LPLLCEFLFLPIHPCSPRAPSPANKCNNNDPPHSGFSLSTRDTKADNPSATEPVKSIFCRQHLANKRVFSNSTMSLKAARVSDFGLLRLTGLKMPVYELGIGVLDFFSKAPARPPEAPRCRACISCAVQCLRRCDVLGISSGGALVFC